MALLYFVFVSPMNHWRERNQKGEDIPAPPTDVELLTEIRDLLKRMPHDHRTAEVSRATGARSLGPNTIRRPNQNWW